MEPNDIQKYSPKSDLLLAHPYNIKTVANKKKNKQVFFKAQKENPFTLLFLSEHVVSAEENIRTQLLAGIASLPHIKILILGEANEHLADYPHISSSKKGYAFAIADVLVLFPSQTNVCFLDLLMAMQYGTIPIVPEDAKTKNIIVPFDPVNEKGNGFIFQKGDVWNIFDAIIRAKENYRFPYDWENIIRACMKN